MSNHLKSQTSPYLLQHSENPVDWYPWGEEAFEKARTEDKPVFLSIGYSTCHWCHVMAHESFEDPLTASYLNQYFISIKVDKEERPDIDSIYMAVCQAFTGSGGWPTSIFMTPDQKPFFAGTYFPKVPRYGMRSFLEILKAIQQSWADNRESLLQSAEEVVQVLQQNSNAERRQQPQEDSANRPEEVIHQAVYWMRRSYDRKNGGFGSAPKFPTPHNLLFLIAMYEKDGDPSLIEMVEKSMIQMYRGGLFDHIGHGFSRYSTDDRFLVPHFEKMLYDNALCILAYSKLYAVTHHKLYLNIAKKTADFVLREMTDSQGGFYCALDADSEGEEGKYYLFTPQEVIEVLGVQQGQLFNKCYDITEQGNFEGKNIPNLLKNPDYQNVGRNTGAGSITEVNADSIGKLSEYRKQRYQLHLDDKILTAWNGLMIGALCVLFRVSKESRYLDAACKAQHFLMQQLSDEDVLYVSYRNGRGSVRGFLDDYAYETAVLLHLYDATLDYSYVTRAVTLCQKAITEFWDEKAGGFYLYSTKHENLIYRPKEVYDGAMPSGNAMMAYVLVRLCLISEELEQTLGKIKDEQIAYMMREAEDTPIGHSMFLLALLQNEYPPRKIVAVVDNDPKEYQRLCRELPFEVALEDIVSVLADETKGYQCIHQKTTYYVCKGYQCLPPSNTLDEDRN